MRAILLAVFILCLPGLGWAGNVALVIGNSAYRSVETLANPVNDARAVADALRTHGFDVILANDLTRAEMLNTLRGFRDAADRSDIAVVYYAGHGMEIGGRNYLVPIDARITDERDARLEMIELQDVMSQMSGAKRMKTVVLDACRDNPFVTGMKRSNTGRNVGRGLALVESAGADTLIAYAAAAGEITPDGAEGGNSPFTRAFLNAMKGPSLDIRLLLGSVRDELRRSVPGAAPFVYSSLGGGTYVINPKPAASPAPTARPDANAMLSDYATAELADSIAIWDAFLDTYAAQSDHTLYILARRNRDLKLAAQGATTTAQAPASRASVNDPVDSPAVSTPQPNVPAPVLPALSRQDAILEIQRLLKGRNCYGGRLDGIYGRRTASGLATLSRESGSRLAMNRNSTAEQLMDLIDALVVVDDARCPDVVIVRKPAAKKRTRPTASTPAPAPVIQAPAPKAAPRKSEPGQTVFRNPPNYCPQFGSSPGCRDGDRIDN
ncbi:caspase family protein [Sedimentitalea todarodis]|uniref:Caspase family protein n=1 Tax=Sedimentitalea todarodis TaxID=1631240 RepID=A0ABU3V959_9RHOB|nr:caspase family protein [Sedimentitalea todarodis]MDU9002700.1 caspase family protein [Sedimentitalea todarodis]